MNYDELIYELLLEHLPGISSALTTLSEVGSEAAASLSDIFTLLYDYRIFVAMLGFTSVLALILKRRYLV